MWTNLSNFWNSSYIQSRKDQTKWVYKKSEQMPKFVIKQFLPYIRMTNVWLSQKGGNGWRFCWLPSKMFDLLMLIPKCIIQKMFQSNQCQHFSRSQNFGYALASAKLYIFAVFSTVGWGWGWGWGGGEPYPSDHLKHEQNPILEIINNISSAVVEGR